jgi:hypothetical protein
MYEYFEKLLLEPDVKAQIWFNQDTHTLVIEVLHEGSVVYSTSSKFLEIDLFRYINMEIREANAF